MTLNTDHSARKFCQYRRKPLSKERLRNWALGYLGRFAATRAHLVVVLERKIKRHLGPEAEPEEMDRWTAEAERVARNMVKLGLVDDRSYAAGRARSLHRQGKSRRAIARNLSAKGVGAEQVEEALAALVDDIGGGAEAVEFDAAIGLARRRRLGPFRRPGGESDEDLRRREYGVLARAGFGYGIARRILEAGEEAELLEHLEDLRADEAGNGR